MEDVCVCVCPACWFTANTHTHRRLSASVVSLCDCPAMPSAYAVPPVTLTTSLSRCRCRNLTCRDWCPLQQNLSPWMHWKRTFSISDGNGCTVTLRPLRYLPGSKLCPIWLRHWRGTLYLHTTTWCTEAVTERLPKLRLGTTWLWKYNYILIIILTQRGTVTQCRPAAYSGRRHCQDSMTNGLNLARCQFDSRPPAQCRRTPHHSWWPSGCHDHTVPRSTEPGLNWNQVPAAPLWVSRPSQWWHWEVGAARTPLLSSYSVRRINQRSRLSALSHSCTRTSTYDWLLRNTTIRHAAAGER